VCSTVTHVFCFVIQRSELRAQYDALVRTTQARETEWSLMRDRLYKADGLEETVRRQELVIEKLEAMINNYLKEKRSRGKPSVVSIVTRLVRFQGAFNDMDRTFLSEHAALGLETQQLQVIRIDNRYDTFVFSSSDECCRRLDDIRQ
jgi:hypothetical protein